MTKTLILWIMADKVSVSMLHAAIINFLPVCCMHGGGLSMIHFPMLHG